MKKPAKQSKKTASARSKHHKKRSPIDIKLVFALLFIVLSMIAMAILSLYLRNQQEIRSQAASAYLISPTRVASRTPSPTIWLRGLYQNCRLHSECASKRCFAPSAYADAECIKNQEQDGAACKYHAECQSNFCGKVGSSTQTVCLSKTRLKSGAACSTNDQCETGNCRFVSLQGQLVGGFNQKYCASSRRAINGNPCQFDQECSSDYCKVTNQGKFCSAKVNSLNIGASCNASSECKSGNCNRLRQNGPLLCLPKGYGIKK
jgi:hypothetical protein